MGSPATPSLWLETSASGLPVSDDPAVDLVGVDALVVAARRRSGSGGSAPLELVPFGGRSDRARRLRRSDGGSRGVGDLLDALPHGLSLAVVSGDADVALEVVALARRLGALGRLWVGASELTTLDAVRAESPATRLLHRCVPMAQPRGAERHAAVLRERDIQGVVVPADRLGAGLVALMRRFGRIVGAEGAEHARMVRAAAGAGADIVSGPSAAVLGAGQG